MPQITKSFTRMAEMFNPFYKLLEPELPVKITSELKKRFVLVREALSDPCELALKQNILGKQLVLLTDASFRSAGFALLIEDNPDQYTQSKRKTLPWRLDQEFHPCTTQDVHPLQRIYMAFIECANFLWEASKPTIVLTDNKSVTRLFQTKTIPPTLWNACDYVLQFNFKIAHIAVPVNTPAAILSTL